MSLDTSRRLSVMKKVAEKQGTTDGYTARPSPRGMTRAQKKIIGKARKDDAARRNMPPTDRYYTGKGQTGVQIADEALKPVRARQTFKDQRAAMQSNEGRALANISAARRARTQPTGQGVPAADVASNGMVPQSTPERARNQDRGTDARAARLKAKRGPVANRGGDERRSKELERRHSSRATPALVPVPARQTGLTQAGQLRAALSPQEGGRLGTGGTVSYPAPAAVPSFTANRSARASAQMHNAAATREARAERLGLNRTADTPESMKKTRGARAAMWAGVTRQRNASAQQKRVAALGGTVTPKNITSVAPVAPAGPAAKGTAAAGPAAASLLPQVASNPASGASSATLPTPVAAASRVARGGPAVQTSESRLSVPDSAFRQPTSRVTPRPAPAMAAASAPASAPSRVATKPAPVQARAASPGVAMKAGMGANWLAKQLGGGVTPQQVQKATGGRHLLKGQSYSWDNGKLVGGRLGGMVGKPAATKPMVAAKPASGSRVAQGQRVGNALTRTAPAQSRVAAKPVAPPQPVAAAPRPTAPSNRLTMAGRYSMNPLAQKAYYNQGQKQQAPGVASTAPKKTAPTGKVWRAPSTPIAVALPKKRVERI